MVQSAWFWATLFGSALVFRQLPHRLRMPFLMFVSIGYVGSLAPLAAAVLMIWSLAFFYLAPLAVGGRGPGRRITPILILSVIAYLAYFKYIPQLLAALAPEPVERTFVIPLGVSYFSFKFIHYAVETSRGNIEDRSLWTFLCWVYLFPIFTAGPIERFDHFLAHRKPTPDRDDVVAGLTRIVHGLIKKFFIGGVVLLPLQRGVDAEKLLDILDVQHPVKVWGYLVLTYLYLYMDFSAYSDIAIGGSRLFGLRIMENFNFPILARSIGDFWKRWHMTLAGWCQAYVYMPILGLTRNPYLAILGTFVVMSQWHAGSLSWLCWGLYHASGVALYLTWGRMKRKRKWKRLDRNPMYRALGPVMTFVFVTGSYPFTLTYGHGGVPAALRIWAKLLFLEWPQ